MSPKEWLDFCEQFEGQQPRFGDGAPVNIEIRNNTEIIGRVSGIIHHPYFAFCHQDYESSEESIRGRVNRLLLVRKRDKAIVFEMSIESFPLAIEINGQRYVIYDMPSVVETNIV